MAPTVQPLGILSCPCLQASPPPAAHLLPLTLPIGTTSQSPFPPFRHASLIETPLSHRESHSSQALGMALPPPHPSLLSLKGIDYPPAPTSWPGEGLEATIPSRPCHRPRWLPPFHWLVLRPPWGAPPLSPSPKCIWAQKAREVEDRPEVVMDRSPGLSTLPSHQQGSSPAHHADPGKGGSSCPMENSDLRSPDQFPTLGWLVP